MADSIFAARMEMTLESALSLSVLADDPEKTGVFLECRLRDPSETDSATAVDGYHWMPEVLGDHPDAHEEVASVFADNHQCAMRAVDDLF